MTERRRRTAVGLGLGLGFRIRIRTRIPVVGFGVGHSFSQPHRLPAPVHSSRPGHGVPVELDGPELAAAHKAGHDLEKVTNDQSVLDRPLEVGNGRGPG